MLFGEKFPSGEAVVRLGREASKGELFGVAARATYVHIATHGYFAPEWVRSSANPTDEELSSPLREHTGATGLSPLVLCGLALAGANLRPDALGRHAGIATAEELSHLDLSGCELVVLSACDTSLGVRRAGQGYASLRAALVGAGARHVLTSLWRVGDAATRELMVDFYRLLWVEGKDPHTALWEARMAARDRGAPFRDWAGWVLTGR